MKSAQRQGILLQNNNALEHSASKAKDFFKANKIQLAGYKPYSPDLAPCDFYLFLKVKENLCVTKFSNVDVVLEHHLTLCEEISLDEWEKN